MQLHLMPKKGAYPPLYYSLLMGHWWDTSTQITTTMDDGAQRDYEDNYY